MSHKLCLEKEGIILLGLKLLHVISLFEEFVVFEIVP